LHHPNKIDRNEIGYRKNHGIPRRGEKQGRKQGEESSGRKQRRERPSRENRTGCLVVQALLFPRSHIR
jgi:hypothetical protein